MIVTINHSIITVVIADAGLCPGNSQTFTENRCLDVISDSTAAFADASSTCEQQNAGTLATFATDGELSTIRSYVSALGPEDSYFWIGYLYNGSLLEDINGNNAPSLLTDDLDGNGQVEETGTCVAVGSDGGLISMSCSSLLGYVCIFTLTSGCGQIELPLYDYSMLLFT